MALVTLSEELAQQAQEAGILSDERIAALIWMELRRGWAWEYMDKATSIVRESAAETMGDLSEDQIMQLINEEIHMMRAEDDALEAFNRSHK